MEEGARQVSLRIDPVTATLYAALIGVFGALAGLVVERLLRLLGRLRFEASGWRLIDFYREDEGWGTGIITAEQAEKEASQVRYRVAIDLFNGKEVPTGLRDTAIVLVLADGSRVSSQPRDLTAVRATEYSTSHDKLAVINVPPRQFVHKDLEGEFEREGAVALAKGEWKRAEFVGKRPKRPLLWRKTYRKTIQEPA